MDKNRKRSYRTKVKCEKCNKIIYSEYRIQHLKRKHASDKDIEFSNDIDPKQRKLSFHSNEKSIKIVENTEPIPVSIVDEANSVNVVSEASETVIVDQPVNVTGECVPELANVMNEVSAKVLVNESFDVVNEPVPGTAVLEVCSIEQSDALSQSSSQLISTDVNEPYQPILESYNPKQYLGESSK